ncbi:MAG: hypothetical protein K0S29_1013, partial [Gammaproteobacteria bacterium]|nr:hypothetical protein [Gammaproteobacteria bacterium]
AVKTLKRIADRHFGIDGHVFVEEAGLVSLSAKISLTNELQGARRFPPTVVLGSAILSLLERHHMIEAVSIVELTKLLGREVAMDATAI